MRKNWRQTLTAIHSRTLLSLLSLICTSENLYAQNTDNLVADINQLKVAYIYNFSKYFTWTNTAKWAEQDNFTICIENASIADGNFATLDGQLTQNKTIRVIDLPASVSQISELCHIWYVDEANYSDSRESLRALNSSDVLTVSDMSGTVTENVVIELVVINNRIQFRINNDLIGAKSLSASSFLLRLAIGE